MKIDDKNICNIVNDLLPLYADNACTEESKRIVEEHVKECASCARTLDAMKAPVEITNSRNMALELTEFKSIKALKRASRKAKIKTAIIIVLIMILAAPIGVLTVNQYNGAGRCFTNFDDIDACTEFMDRWVNSGFEAVLGEMEPMEIYEDLIRKESWYYDNPYKDYYAIDVNGTICYFNGQDEFYTAKELI
ncbi:MAG: zf-HC2 domain-containing protein, partial [Eubacterium sp.]|nr:zf-HC2 domain-containing protein [Eubacterium sp.]